MFATSSPITQQEVDLLDDSRYEETEEGTEDDDTPEFQTENKEIYYL